MKTRILIALLAASIIGGNACANRTAENVSVNEAPGGTPTTTLTPVSLPSPSVVPTTNFLPITLPVLDAFFAEESFTTDLKNRLSLSDEQVSRLREAARRETSVLRETDDYLGRTETAKRRADQTIREIVGEKADQLYALVRERWAGVGAPGQPAGTVNAVPNDTRIVVNAPAYRMDVFESGQLVKSYKIGIGYPEFPLPTGNREAKSIIFNPTWTPPDEPWVEAPSSKVKVGEKVEAGSDLNPLGPVKIPIGLPSLIHGGKQPSKLGGFASHGCVGLTNQQVIDFSKVLARIGGANLSDEQVAEFQKNKTETKNVPLANPVAVELRYETIVVEDGLLHVYRDVYGRGTNTDENLRRVLETYGVKLEDLSADERTQVTAALDQMGRNATGQEIDPAKVDENPKKDKNPKGTVTRQVKGEKEVVVEVAALSGKGYPSPVALDTGGSGSGKSSKGKPAATARGKRKS